MVLSDTAQSSYLPRRVALVGTYPPTACGIATFTANLREAIAQPESGWEASVIRVLESPGADAEPAVLADWVQGDPDSLEGAVATLNGADVVLLQHEFGIFGGPDGIDVLSLVNELRVPLVTVVHTVPARPSVGQLAILQHLSRRSAAVVVQSRSALERLSTVVPAAIAKSTVIAHGAAPNFVGPLELDVPANSILTWGLIGPGKGVEHGIDALARVRAHGIDANYVVAGRTHPKVRLAHGESYRESLRARARHLGVESHVILDDSYRDWVSLRTLIRSVDVVLLPYDSREQVTSGVLVEGLASGKPIVATRFPHAVELLGDGTGVVVRHGDTRAMAMSLSSVLGDAHLAAELSRRATSAAAPLLWSSVGESYRTFLDRVIGSVVVR
jgi:glycosyltransferase involved in cell wall biosynthesis